MVKLIKHFNISSIIMSNCLFCKIVKEGEVLSTKLFENEKVLAFLDINPVHPGHTLVVPKEHFTNLHDTPEELLKEMIVVTKKLSIAIMKAVKADGINLMMNNFAPAGQVIFHTHWHIVPRYSDDGLRLWKGKPLEDAEEVKKLIETFL